MPFNYVLGNKKALYYNMKQYYELKKDNVFNYLPITFHIEGGLQDPQFLAFQKYYKDREK